MQPLAATIDETLSWAEIRRRFPDQFVLLGDPVLECGALVSGVVWAHGPSKRALLQLIPRDRPTRCGVHFTGQLRAVARPVG